MVLDVVCEQIVQKRFEGKEMLKLYGIGIFALTVGALLVVLTVVLMKMGSALTPVIVLLLAGLIWLTVRMFRSLFVEYEYDLVNGELTIDKIVSQSSRSTLLSFDLKQVEKFYQFDIESFNRNEYENVFFYSYSESPADAVVLVYPDSDYGRTALVISPDERMFEALKKCINRLVVREGFPESKKA